ncbi:hypothetical protein ACTJI8_04870 [Microbacterium sp. 22303]|uniref:hypothetical protein n=1 Tax=Microbacterium sp. 22303 TaxID=3453905 RepID=UPI003F855B91
MQNVDMSPRTLWRKDNADQKIGEALVDLIMSWSEWCHRRVDSIHPLEGERGRRRHSIDCTPPPDPRLHLDDARRSEKSIEGNDGQMILPLGLVAKGPLRHFDACDPNGTPLPILRSDEISQCEVSMLAYMLEVDGVQLTTDARDALLELVGPKTSIADHAAVRRLLTTGIWRDVHVWSLKETPTEVTRGMIRTFSSHFLLLAVLDSRMAGTRQVLKFSYHWGISNKIVDILSAPLIAIGASRRIEVPLDQAAATRSFHFEFQTPDGLRCLAVRLPPSGNEGTTSGGRSDSTGLPVAHAHGSYSSEPTEPARVYVQLPRRSLWLATTLASLFTLVVAAGLLLLPFAKEVWLKAPDSAAALLIAAPAVYFGLLAAGREHTLVSGPLRFLRLLMFLSAVSLFSIAASIVGELHQPWLDLLWWAILVWHVVIFGFLLIGRITVAALIARRMRSHRDVRPHTYVGQL